MSNRFDFVKCVHERARLENAYNAITRAEAWDFFKNGGDYYSYSDNRMRKVKKEMEKEHVGQMHSGSSYAVTMRYMEGIATLGFDEFKREFEAQQK
jgi:hypothetical protein